MSFCILDK